MNPLAASIHRSLLTACWGSLLFLGPVGTASAAVTYLYTGNNFTIIADSPAVAGTYTTSMSVSGSMTFGSPLAPNLVNQDIVPLSFSFSDGRNSLTHNSNLSDQFFSVSTDSLSAIFNWSVGLRTTNVDPIRSIFTSNNDSFVQDQGGIQRFVGGFDSGEVFSNPGFWNLVPEPGAAALLAAGLMLLACKRNW